jgi:predicted secreted protein
MAVPIFIPGYQAEITLNSDDVTLIANVLSFSDDQTAIPKSTFGSKYRRTIAGQGLFTVDVSGHLGVDETATLWALRSETDPVAVSIQIGEAGAATDAGIIAGSAVITNLSYTTDSEGNWAWSATLEGDGEPTFTAPI